MTLKGFVTQGHQHFCQSTEQWTPTLHVSEWSCTTSEKQFKVKQKSMMQLLCQLSFC